MRQLNFSYRNTILYIKFYYYILNYLHCIECITKLIAQIRYYLQYALSVVPVHIKGDLISKSL